MATIPPAPGQTQEKDLCVIDLGIPPDLVWKPSSLDSLLRVCASLCWTDFERRFNENASPSSEKVKLIPPTVLCNDLKQPAVRFIVQTETGLASEATASMRETWQDLMKDIKLGGVELFLESPSYTITGFLRAPPDYPLTRWCPSLMKSVICVTAGNLNPSGRSPFTGG